MDEYPYHQITSTFAGAAGSDPAWNDLRAGHAETLEWFRRSGAAEVDKAQSAPLWGRTFDFAYEAEVAALARGR
jgi:hypothetical protein